MWTLKTHTASTRDWVCTAPGAKCPAHRMEVLGRGSFRVQRLARTKPGLEMLPSFFSSLPPSFCYLTVWNSFPRAFTIAVWFSRCLLLIGLAHTLQYLSISSVCQLHLGITAALWGSRWKVGVTPIRTQN